MDCFSPRPVMHLCSIIPMPRDCRTSRPRCTLAARSFRRCTGHPLMDKTVANRDHSCHGGAIFPGVIDPATGKSIIANKRVTGFTTKGEEEEGVLDTIKSWNRPTIEASAASCGATCKLKYSVSSHHVLLLSASRCLSCWSVGCIYHYRWTPRYGCQSS